MYLTTPRRGVPRVTDDVTFVLHARHGTSPEQVVVPWTDANEILGRARENVGAFQSLHHRLNQKRDGDKNREIVPTQAMREARTPCASGVSAC
jgi:hypothetical protein